LVITSSANSPTLRRPWYFYLGWGLARLILFTCARYRVAGAANLPAAGPVLVCSNHLHLADIPVVVVSLRRKVIFMAKEDLFSGRLSRHLVHNFGAFPVRRGQIDRQAIREAETALAKGWALVMFPEGRRSLTRQLQPAFPGSALVASRSGVPILPIGITGTEQLRKKWWMLRRPRIAVNIGAPFRLPSSEGVRLDSEELDRRTGLIMQRIAALLPPEYRGHYRDSAGGQYAV